MALDLNKIKQDKKQANTSNNDLLAKIGDFMSQDLSFGKAKMSDKRKEFFYSEFYILISSGVDVKTAIEIIEEQSSKKNDIDLYAQIKKNIIDGASLSEALNSTGFYSNYEYFSIQIGEESGKLQDVLKALHKYYDKKIKQKRQLINTFSYPVLVLGMAIAAVVFMMKYMVPMFVDIFNRFDAELPALTQLIVDISAIFESYFVFFLLLTSLLFVIYLYLKKNTRFKIISSSIIIKIPFFGTLVKMVYLQRFFQSMSLLVAARTPMLKAIGLVKNMVNFYLLEESLSQIENSILNGKLLHESMKTTGFFDVRIISLIKVAEEVNRLDTIFENLHQRYTEELEHKVAVLSNMMEPILIIFVGLLVAVILIAMYLPMFQLSTSMY